MIRIRSYRIGVGSDCKWMPCLVVYDGLGVEAT